MSWRKILSAPPPPDPEEEESITQEVKIAVDGLEIQKKRIEELGEKLKKSSTVPPSPGCDPEKTGDGQ